MDLDLPRADNRLGGGAMRERLSLRENLPPAPEHLQLALNHKF